MLKKILSFVLIVSVLALVPVMAGCEQDEIQVKQTNTVKDMPVEENRPVVK